MDLTTLLLILPIVLLIYNGAGLLMDSTRTIQMPWSQRRSHESHKSLRRSAGIGSKLGFNKIFLDNAKFREKLELQLVRTGHIFGWTAADVLFYKEAGVVLIALALWQGNVTDPVAWIVGLPIGFYVPDVFLTLKGAERRAEIQRQLPGFIDLLALALESGLDLMTGVERILDKMKPNALREELQTLVQENRLGTPRKEALQHLAFRVDLSDVHSLTSMIIQSEELGTSLATVLRTYAEDMRSRRILRAEEIAGKAPVKLLFPMMVFFFPIVFIIIFGPLALNLMTGNK